MRLLVLASMLVVAGCKKGGTPKVDKTGWHRGSDEDRWACWYPSNYEEMNTTDRMIARSKNLDAMISQWNGSRNDGVSFQPRLVEDVETVLLGHPDDIEEVSRKNVEMCRDALKSGSTIAWGQWLTRLPDQLTEGECPHPPLDYTLYDYLDIGREWHIPAPVCKNDHIVIRASGNDFYQIEDNGPFINAAGDPEKPAHGDLPCTIEGCLMGQLVMRFRAENGIETIIPIGLEKTWIAPDHGEITVMINDTSFYDNKFKIESGIEHHTSIEYSPVSK